MAIMRRTQKTALVPSGKIVHSRTFHSRSVGCCAEYESDDRSASLGMLSDSSLGQIPWGSLISGGATIFSKLFGSSKPKNAPRSVRSAGQVQAIANAMNPFPADAESWIVEKFQQLFTVSLPNNEYVALMLILPASVRQAFLVSPPMGNLTKRSQGAEAGHKAMAQRTTGCGLSDEKWLIIYNVIGFQPMLDAAMSLGAMVTDNNNVCPVTGALEAKITEIAVQRGLVKVPPEDIVVVPPIVIRNGQPPVVTPTTPVVTPVVVPSQTGYLTTPIQTKQPIQAGLFDLNNPWLIIGAAGLFISFMLMDNEPARIIYHRRIKKK